MTSRKEKRQQYKEKTYTHLQRCLQHHVLRRQSPDLVASVNQVSAWQSNRIAETYRDFATTDRYRLALDFFRNDMYSDKDYSKRDSDAKKVYPVIERVMPNRLFYILSLVMELHALTMELDEKQVMQLKQMGVTDQITAQAYAEAYRLNNNYKDRRRQIELVVNIGWELDNLTGKSYLGAALKLSAKPAAALGLGDLHQFLQRGYTAFMAMKGASEFIEIIQDREVQILDAVFANTNKPFQLDTDIAL